MTAKSTRNVTLSSRAKRGICFLVFVFSCFAATTPAQVKRPKILGISYVHIYCSDIDGKEPARFYSRLGLTGLGGFQSSSAVAETLAINKQQTIQLAFGPTHTQKPDEPGRNNVEAIVFETSDVVALRRYLKQQGVKMVGESENITLVDPEGHSLGFVQGPSMKNFELREPQTSTRLIHAGFIVHDRAATEHFYKDILGFRPYWHGGMTEDQTDWVSLQVPDGTDWIEFMVNVPENADQRLRGIMNHIALGVPDIHAAQKQLLTNGMKLTEEPKIGRDGKWQLNVYDPDQTRIEFMEFTPVEKPCCSEFTGPHPKP